MTAAAARNPMGMPAAGRKKARKPYKITRPRERWTADEHDRFLHALLLFGRDWKTIEHFVATKTATQIRSHAQKFFLKAHKLGFAAALPPAQPRRAAVFSQQSSASCRYLDDAASAGVQQSLDDWACTSSAGSCWQIHDDVSFMGMSNSGEQAPTGGASPIVEAWLAADCMLQDDTIQLPLSLDDPRFAEVYRFVGDAFGSAAPRPVEAQLQRLLGMDPVVAETILLVLCNLEDNLSG